MRLGLVFVSVSVSLLGAISAWAQPADPGDAPSSPPPAGYPPPPPGGYPPAGYAAPAPSAERTANNSIYIEGLGPGLFYSLNYDRTFGDFAGRVGFSYISVGASSTTTTNNTSYSTSSVDAHVVTVPLTLSYLGIGSKKNIFEIGAGATVINAGAGFSSLGAKSESASTTFLLGDLIFGYRLQPPDGGFMLRTGISPVFGHGIFLPWPYLALGGCF